MMGVFNETRESVLMELSELVRWMAVFLHLGSAKRPRFGKEGDICTTGVFSAINGVLGAAIFLWFLLL